MIQAVDERFGAITGRDSKAVLSPAERITSVAVCLAAFNGKSWLKEQLESILNQENVAVIVFVSVDLSSDGTEAWIDAYAKNDSRVVPLPVGLRFGGAAANFFRLLGEVDVSAFDYVSLADQDDIWYSDKLWRATRMLADSAADCYSSNVLAFWEDGSEKLINKAQPQRDWDFLFEAAGPGCTYVLKRKVVEHLKPLLRERRDIVAKLGLHDWFIYAFARAHGYEWVIDPRPSMSYRQHSSNQVGVNAGWRAFAWRMRKIMGGWGIAQARLIVQLTGLEAHPFFQPWKMPGRFGMLWLSLHAFSCRRKLSDAFIFAAMCVLLSITGDRSDG